MRLGSLTLVLLNACSSQMPPVSAGPDMRLLLAPAPASCDPGAPAPSQVRVATWNIAAAQLSSIADLAGVLANVDADVVLLQEVDVGVRRSGGQNQAEALANQLGAAYAFGEAIPWDGGHYGLATLSRLPFQVVRRISLDDPSASERRIGLDVTLCFGAATIEVVNTHADVIAEAGARNAMQLVDALRPAIGNGLIVAGDFNALPGDPGPQAALAAGLQDLLATRDASPTWGDRREDFIFGDARLAPRVTAGQMVPTDKSDHRLLFVDLAGAF
jgi:endonuclease/exonuclease/phosphatase family metal-dependent hydrolase